MSGFRTTTPPRVAGPVSGELYGTPEIMLVGAITRQSAPDPDSLAAAIIFLSEVQTTAGNIFENSTSMLIASLVFGGLESGFC
jgi:hypothetical protein